jgi:ABC-2 type transport system permease protein
MKNIFHLALHDLGTALKNKTILLILFIPCFVFLALELVDKAEESGPSKIGLVEGISYPPLITQSLAAAAAYFDVAWVPSEEEGKRLLKERVIDGLLIRTAEGFTEQPEEGAFSGSLEAQDRRPPSAVRQPAFSLWVLKKESLQTLGLVERFSALQQAAEGHQGHWISDVQSLHEGGVQRLMLPTWILMLVLLIGFIILPTQVAEEKEKKLLLALLQTPMRESQWLIAKVILGMVLIAISIFLLHLLGQFWPANPLDYLAVLFVGSFCFSAYGVFVGMLCRNQASARTLGVVFYLPHLLPSALADVSQQLTTIAPLLPSYQFYTSLQATLLEDGRIANMLGEWVYLFLVGALAFYASYRLMKRRWLM